MVELVAMRELPMVVIDMTGGNEYGESSENRLYEREYSLRSSPCAPTMLFGYVHSVTTACVGDP